MINEALSENSQPKYEQLLNNCFYYNDGKSAQRAADFIFSLNIRNNYYAQKHRSLEDLIINILNWKKNVKTSKSDLVKPKTIDERIENGFKNFIKSP